MPGGGVSREWEREGERGEEQTGGGKGGRSGRDIFTTLLRLVLDRQIRL